MIKIVYAFFLGILLTVFVAVGINTFYPTPAYPQTPIMDVKPIPPSDELNATYQKQSHDYQEQLSVYNRNVSIIALVAAVLFLTAGLLLASRIDVMGDGLLLGGVFTLIYSMSSGLASQESTYRFIVVSVGLVVAFTLGYIKFIRPQAKVAKKKR